MHPVHDPDSPVAAEIGFPDFLAVDIRVGTIRAAAPVPKARNPAYRLRIDFGPVIGEKTSAAQITVHYTPEQLIGQRVLAVVNFPARQVGAVRSEVLVLGVADADGAIRLVVPDAAVPDGGRLA